MPPLFPVLELACLPAVFDGLASAARVELDAIAVTGDATAGASVQSRRRRVFLWW